ncbi:STAS domain-containing protein [Alkanindiges sp. WGS2144]|uniref:STAS domain-containing protein n=1 Tax=Alkanindiges sp. WGS2144 TaxID=3366808 RepID=UPI003751701E
MTAQLSLHNQVMTLTGSVNFDNAAQVYQQGLLLLKQQTSWPVYIDLSALTSSNTITLAVFVQWLRQGLAGQQLYLQKVPAKMQAIIGASSLMQSFGLNASVSD